MDNQSISVEKELRDLGVKLINIAVVEARIDALLDLERWIKFHNLNQEMILNGIEHMVMSNLQTLNQLRLDNSDRIATLKQQLEAKDKK